MMLKLPMMLKPIIAFPVVFLLLSCATQKQESSEFVPNDLYEMDISYDREDQAFLFKLKSDAGSAICVPRMRWPSESGGHYFFGDDNIYFTEGDIRYDIKNLASGYCTPQSKNGCIYILKKNDQLFGRLPIEDFAVPSEMYRDDDFDPQLHYPYKPRFCK